MVDFELTYYSTPCTTLFKFSWTEGNSMDLHVFVYTTIGKVLEGYGS